VADSQGDVVSEPCTHPWWDADDERQKIVCGECREEIKRPPKEPPTPRQLRDTANSPWSDE